MTKADDQTSTRDRILAAAVAEIAENGWSGARTRSIADRAGVNNALVHYHFSTMEDLLVEAAATTVAGLADAVGASLQDPDMAAGMRTMVDEVAAVDPTQPEWQVLMEAMLHTPRVPRLAEMTLGVLTAYRSAMTDRLAEAITDGELPKGTDTEGLALALMALFDGLGLYAYVDPDLDIRRAGEAVVALMTRGDTP